MPTYDYKCSVCKAEKEVLCSMSERESLRPSCCDTPMIGLITNNQRHTDNTTYRKGTGGKDWR